MTRRPGLLGVAVCAGCVAASPAWSQPAVKKNGAANAAAARTFAVAERERITSVFKVLEDGGDFAKAQGDLRRIFDEVIAVAPASDGTLFADADVALRLVEQVQKLPKESRADALKFLRAHDALAREILLEIAPRQRFEGVYNVLQRLRTAHGDKVAEYPSLTAAICLVHDRPHYATATRTQTSPGKLIDPCGLFAYYVGNESRMLFGLKSLPAEAMMYLVDTTAGVEELAWALAKHAGDRNVGKRYSDLVYDTAAFKFGKPKKISTMPYSLENLARVGGVCEEQSYYAANVARAIGVPAAMVFGQSSEMSHAWVAFLQMRGSTLEWNMNEGHYDEYEKLQGYAIHPQTVRQVTDDDLAMTAGALSEPVSVRHAAAALVDAARRIGALRQAQGQLPAPVETGLGGMLTTPRAVDAAAQQTLLQAAVTLCPCWDVAWGAVRDVGPSMTAKDRQGWFGLLQQQCGRRYPGFAFGILVGLISPMSNPGEQSAAWDWVFNQYRTKPDLAGEARIRQGKMWEKAGDKDRAYRAYVDVALQFPNDGKKAIEALLDAEKMLKSAGHDAAAIDMYKDAWRRMSRPGSTAPWAFRQSNFFQVGEAYAGVLERNGRANEAVSVRRQIEAGVDKDKR